jgi:hypothetical protein
VKFDEAKEHIKSVLSLKDFDLVDEHARELFFRHANRGIGVIFEEADIASFAEDADKFGDYENEPMPCSIRSNNHVEMLLAESSTRRTPPPRFLFETRGEIDFLSPAPDGIRIHVGFASATFLNFFINTEVLNLLFLLRPIHMRDDFSKIGDLKRRFVTVRARNLEASSPRTAYNRALPLINGCLFTLAYMRDISFQISDDWPQRPLAKRPFRYTDRLAIGEVPLPQGRYDENLARLYLRGVGSIDPFVRYLSFYQVLEYLFGTVSNAELFKRLAGIIADPAFRPTERYLSRVVQDTLAHKRETDETEMLKLVLREYVDEDELLSFIEDYELYLREKIFSRAYEMFGLDVKLAMQKGHIIGGVARRVKHVRNALVHSADRYEGYDRYIPSRSNEERLEKEVPLVRFLAEKVIISAASRTG